MDIEAADKAIDDLIEKRATEEEAANYVAETWRASEERYIFGRGEELRLGWLDFHRRQQAVFESLAAEHKRAAGELIDLPARRSQAT